MFIGGSLVLALFWAVMGRQIQGKPQYVVVAGSANGGELSPNTPTPPPPIVSPDAMGRLTRTGRRGAAFIVRLSSLDE